MAPPIQHFQHQQILPISEIVYTLIVVFFCLFIYYKTKEYFELTNHKGIKHFRNIFLFLGLGYLSRFFFYILTISSITFDFFVPKRMLFLLSLILMSYFGTLAISSMTYSVVWKKIRENHFVIASHILAIIIVVLSIIFGTIEPILLSQFLLLIVAIVLSVVYHKSSKKFKNTITIYILIFIFWFLNIFLLNPAKFFPFELKAAIQLLSLGVFVIIFYKIFKWLK